ncbi:MAG: phage tail tape measure protein [Firmicutes bacterium]|nr:phage tail tape measure protein [Bacillota bacterium]
MTRGNTVVARVGLDDKGFQQGVAKIQRGLKVVQSEFAAASTKLGDFGKSTEGLKLKSDSLNKQITLQKDKVAALNKSYLDSIEKKGQDAKATENLKIKLNYAIASMHKMENELSKVNKQIEVQSSGFTKLGNKLETVGTKMKTVGNSFSSAGKKLSMTVTTPIIAAGTGLYKLASDFEDANNNIRIGTGATGEALKNLESDFKAVYTSVNTNIGDASSVIADLNTRTGLSGKALQTLSVQMLRLAKITKEDINTLIPAATRMFQDAGLKTEEYAKALDFTFKVSQSTGIGVSRLQQLMTQFGGPLRQMGFDWKTSAAMLGKFEKEGVNTELVIGSLRIALGKMAREGISEPNKALEEMVKRIKEAGTAGRANALALEMFGAKAGPDMAAAIREGRLDLDQLLNTLKSSPETIEKAVKDTETVKDKFIVLKNKMAVSLEPLGKNLIDAIEKAMPAIEKLIITLTKIVEKFNALSPRQQEMILKFTLLVAALGPVIAIIGKLISLGGTLFSVFGSISTAIGAAGGVSGALGVTFTALTGPIGIVVASIVGLITIFIALNKNGEKLRTKTKEVFSEIKGTINEITEKLKIVFESFTDYIKNVWNSWGYDIKQATSKVWESIKMSIVSPVNSAKDGVKKAIDSIFGFFSNLKIPEIKIPKIKLPHFKLKGEFNLMPPSVPKLDVNWYAKGGIFNSPSIIGIGEAGSEAVLPIDRLDDILASALEKVKGVGVNTGLTLHIEKFINNTDKDIEQLAYELEFYRQRISKGRGGD